jgi:hypothetical protein
VVALGEEKKNIYSGRTTMTLIYIL